MTLEAGSLSHLGDHQCIIDGWPTATLHAQPCSGTATEYILYVIDIIGYEATLIYSAANEKSFIQCCEVDDSGI